MSHAMRRCVCTVQAAALGLLAATSGCTFYSSSTDGVPTPECSGLASGNGACSWSPPYPSLGSGPDVVPTVAAVAGDDLVAASEGAVFTLNLITGHRLLVSAGATAGHGPAISSARALRIGPDGAYYVADETNRVYRVDPGSGDRAVYYDPADIPCPVSGEHLMPLASRGFAFAPNGEFYTIAESSVTGYSHDAIVHFPGGVCAVLSDSGQYSDQRHSGPGWASAIDSLQYENGAFWVYATQAKALYRVDPITGARSLVSDFTAAANAGEQLDEQPIPGLTVTRDAAWYLGLVNRHTVPIRIDLTTGVRTPIMFTGAFAPGSFGRAINVFPDPNRPLLYLTSRGVFVMHAVTGRSNWLSG